MRRLIKRIVRNDDAATAVEYAIMLSLILMAVFATVILLGQNTKSSWQQTNANLNSVGFGTGGGS